MGSYYTVVQYVPDPVADEKINVGIIAVAGDRIKGRFLRNWSRIRNFGGEDVAFLKDFAYRVDHWTPDMVALPGLDLEVRLDEQGLRRIAGRWMNSVQFTELRGSVLDLDQLLDEMGRKFLRETTRARAGYRDRRVAARIAYVGIENAVRDVVGDQVKKFVHRNVDIEGNLDTHRVDVALQNGRPQLAARGLSFEGPTTKDLEKEIDATAWAVDDIRGGNAEIRLAVVAIPPRTAKSKAYDRAIHIFTGLNAEVVDEKRLDEWARTMAGKALQQV